MENNQSVASIEYMIKSFQEIKSKGFVESIADYKYSERNDAAVGDTYEFLLGEKRNNISGPDHKGWEIKTKRKLANTATSLFSLKPTFPKDGNKYTVHKYGVFDGYYEETLKLSTTLYANKFSNVHKLIKTLPGWKKNSKGKIRSGYSVKKHPDGIQDFWMKLEIDEDENKLYLLVLDTNKELFDKTVFWSFEDIEDSFMTKLSKSVFINADVKTENGKEYFLYTDAIFIEPTFRDFINGLENGLIRFDHKYSPDKSGPTEGKFHDHGSGFRINKKEDFKMLFSNIVEVS